jgi:hypothetical protein
MAKQVSKMAPFANFTGFWSAIGNAEGAHENAIKLVIETLALSVPQFRTSEGFVPSVKALKTILEGAPAGFSYAEFVIGGVSDMDSRYVPKGRKSPLAAAEGYRRMLDAIGVANFVSLFTLTKEEYSKLTADSAKAEIVRELRATAQRYVSNKYTRNFSAFIAQTVESDDTATATATATSTGTKGSGKTGANSAGSDKPIVSDSARAKGIVVALRSVRLDAIGKYCEAWSKEGLPLPENAARLAATIEAFLEGRSIPKVAARAAK